MEYSEKYLEKITGEKSYGGQASMVAFGLIRRYGDYCRLEERMENARVVNANKAVDETGNELSIMASKDGLL